MDSGTALSREGREMTGGAKAMQPEEVTRLVAERLNAGDAAGMAALYEPQAVLAYPPDQPVTGREAIQASCQQMADGGATFAVETPLPTVRFEDLALTSTRLADNIGVRVQVPRRQPDGSWLRIMDRPEVPQP
jgi:ketosteroid isomerase-like protein